MITSIFLLFVATGITIASAVYGFGGVFTMMVFLVLATAIILGMWRTVSPQESDDVTI